MDDAERRRKYLLEKVTGIGFRFSPGKDDDILARLDTVDSKQGYIRMLIKNDLVRRGIMPGPVESYDMTVHKGRDKTAAYNTRINLKLVTGGPDQPMIDYLNGCPSKIDYVRRLIREDIDNGGSVADRITTQKVYMDVETVRASAERTVKLLGELAQQDKSQAESISPALNALAKWIDTHK